MSPPCCDTMDCAIDRPNPVPSGRPDIIGLEQPVLERGGDARPVVLDFYAHHEAVAFVSDRELTTGARAERYRCVRDAFKRLHGIASNVQQCLHELFVCAEDLRNRWVVVALEKRAIPYSASRRVRTRSSKPVNIDPGAFGHAVRPEHAIDQIPQSIGLFDDYVGVVAEPGVLSSRESS